MLFGENIPDLKSNECFVNKLNVNSFKVVLLCTYYLLKKCNKVLLAVAIHQTPPSLQLYVNATKTTMFFTFIRLIPVITMHLHQ